MCKNLDCANLSYETWIQFVSHDSSLIRFAYQNQSSIICVLRTYSTVSDVCHRFQGKTLALPKTATFRKLMKTMNTVITLPYLPLGTYYISLFWEIQLSNHWPHKHVPWHYWLGSNRKVGMCFLGGFEHCILKQFDRWHKRSVNSYCWVVFDQSPILCLKGYDTTIHLEWLCYCYFTLLIILIRCLISLAFMCK